VDVHPRDYTEMDTAFYSLGLRSLDKKEGSWLAQQSRSDSVHRMVLIEKWWQKDVHSPLYTPSIYDTVYMEFPRYQDGLSLVYFARKHVMDSAHIRVPTIVYGKKGFTQFYFTRNRTTEEIDAVPSPVRVVKFHGKAEFEGIFGLTGEFKGWFSDDAAAVPVKAEMKVILGNVKIELAHWKRKGWTPPVLETSAR